MQMFWHLSFYCAGDNRDSSFTVIDSPEAWEFVIKFICLHGRCQGRRPSPRGLEEVRAGFHNSASDVSASDCS
jgi:hypothetical protein